MKKTILLLAILPFLSLLAVEPSLTTKDLSTSPVIGSTMINYAAGTRRMNNDVAFSPTGNYTVEIKAKLLSTAVKGLLLEARNSSRVGFRMAITSNGINNLSALNYTNETNPVAVNSDANDAATYHTFRFAVEGTNVHIYRDGVYISSTTTEGIYKDDLLKDNNGNFESVDVSMWNFVAAGQGLTSVAGQFRTGASAMKLVNIGTTNVQSSLTIKGLKPSTAYALSFYAKYLSKTVNKGNMKYEIKLGSLDGLGNFVKNSGIASNNLVGNPTSSMDASLATWTLNGAQFTTGLADSVVVLDISGWNGDNTYVIDDMVLNEVETTPSTGATIGSNLVSNGDFATDASGWLAGSWPLGNVTWAATADELSNPTGGQLQIKDVAWAGPNNGTYSKSVDVMPNKTYKLSAKTSQKVVGTRSVKLVDGVANVSTDYTTVAAVAPATNLTTYYINTTPILTTGPASTSLSMQFSTRTGHTASPSVIMTLDDVVLQEYEATFPTYLNYGKAYQSEALNVDIAYINYDLTGAYAPNNGTTSLTNSNKKLIVSVVNGKLNVKGVNAGDKVQVFNSLGMIILSTLAKDGANQFELKAKGVMVVKVNNGQNKIIL